MIAAVVAELARGGEAFVVLVVVAVVATAAVGVVDTAARAAWRRVGPSVLLVVRGGAR